MLAADDVDRRQRGADQEVAPRRHCTGALRLHGSDGGSRAALCAWLSGNRAEKLVPSSGSRRYCNLQPGCCKLGPREGLRLAHEQLAYELGSRKTAQQVRIPTV